MQDDDDDDDLDDDADDRDDEREEEPEEEGQDEVPKAFHTGDSRMCITRLYPNCYFNCIFCRNL